MTAATELRKTDIKEKTLALCHGAIATCKHLIILKKTGVQLLESICPLTAAWWDRVLFGSFFFKKSKKNINCLPGFTFLMPTLHMGVGGELKAVIPIQNCKAHGLKLKTMNI